MLNDCVLSLLLIYHHYYDVGGAAGVVAYLLEASFPIRTYMMVVMSQLEISLVVSVASIGYVAVKGVSSLITRLKSRPSSPAQCCCCSGESCNESSENRKEK